MKALVKEPAISDGRIRPGDKLISANGQDCGAMSHSELISFLRSLPESSVTLKFYRDASRAQTPISTPTESEFSRSYPNLTFLNTSKSKPLRFEAKEMVKSLQASRTSLDGISSKSSSRKLNSRPFSPCANRRNFPLANSSSSPLVYNSDEPKVEMPLSPENETFSFENSDALQIEEITDDNFAMEIETMIEDFECVFKSETHVEVSRPNHLDLFNPEKHCRPSYTFKNPQ